MKYVLIIEDSEMFVNFFKTKLAKFDAYIDVARTYKEANELITKTEYDLFIVDIYLPQEDEKDNKNGLDVIGRGADPKKTIISSAFFKNKVEIEDISKKLGVPKDRIFKKPIVENLDAVFESILGESLFQKDVSNIFRGMFDYAKNWVFELTLKKIFYVFLACFFAYSFVPTFIVWRHHKFHQKFVAEVSAYAESKFANYHVGQEPGKGIYREETILLSNKGRIIIQQFPEGFMKIIIFDETKDSPEVMWVDRGDYLKKVGIDSTEDSFIDLLVKTWKKTSSLNFF